MMGYQYGMMNGFQAYGVLGMVSWIVLIVDLALLGLWLWKQVSK